MSAFRIAAKLMQIDTWLLLTAYTDSLSPTWTRHRYIQRYHRKTWKKFGI